MSRICELHDQAMELMNQAIKLKADGMETEALSMLSRACELECESAYLVERKSENEPSRGMLYLGAASLAKQINDYNLSERLVCDGLSGFPTERVREDLHRLLDEIKFERMSVVIAPDLTNDETVFRFMGGNAVGHGRILAKPLIKRIDALENLVVRSTQRMMNCPFENGNKKHPNIPDYALNIEWAEAGSFGIKVSITQPVGQSLFLFAPKPAEILQDIVHNIYLIGNGEEDKINDLISNEEYRYNFIAHAKEILPDGDSIKEVGIISKNNKFFLKKTKKEIMDEIKSKRSASKVETSQQIIYRGYFKVSDGIKGQIQLVYENESEKPMIIYVRDALDEVAKKYFGDLVEIQVEWKNNKPFLVDINELTQ